MEVGVKIIAENVLTGVRRHTNSCYVTYVALDDQGVPTACRDRARDARREAAV